MTYQETGMPHDSDAMCQPERRERWTFFRQPSSARGRTMRRYEKQTVCKQSRPCSCQHTAQLELKRVRSSLMRLIP